MLLAGDIGGTKVDLGVFSPQEGPRAPIAEATFASTSYPDAETLIREFLDEIEIQVDRVCLGVPGPIIDGGANITNLPWAIDQRELMKSLNVSSVHLLNDLEAMGYGLLLLEQDDLLTLQTGQPVQHGTIAVIAPGTGLGEAFLSWNGSQYVAHASEGGHTDFGPNNPLQLDLLRYLQNRYSHVSYERVCAGQGFPNIYSFLRDSGRASEPDWLAQEIAEVDDPAPIIVRHALDEEASCGLCAATLELLVSILGAEAGNLALKVLSDGGVFLGGGVPPHILPSLKGEGFLQAFCQKGRLSYVLERMPVHVILSPKVVLLGAARFGLDIEPS
ncbi:MAG: glucokinase [Chloroflexi bacterium RBG_13_56_8]|nr:MAG: glucokinase [Chloroflexi bacterium RBG_13_56_8]